MEVSAVIMLNEQNQMIDNALVQLLTYDHGKFDRYYDQLETLGLIKYDYGAFLITEPINIEVELRRVPDADFDLCCALLTMLFREDHFDNGSFDYRVERGDVKLIVEHMRDLIREAE